MFPGLCIPYLFISSVFLHNLEFPGWYVLPHPDHLIVLLPLKVWMMVRKGVLQSYISPLTLFFSTLSISLSLVCSPSTPSANSVFPSLSFFPPLPFPWESQRRGVRRGMGGGGEWGEDGEGKEGKRKGGIEGTEGEEKGERRRGTRRVWVGDRDRNGMGRNNITLVSIIWYKKGKKNLKMRLFINKNKHILLYFLSLPIVPLIERQSAV